MIKWNKEKLQELNYDYIRLTDEELCSKYNCSSEQIRYAGNKILKLKKPKIFYKKRHYGISPLKGRIKIKYNLEELIELLTAGKTNSFIADKFNICLTTLSKIIKKHNIFLPNKPKRGRRKYKLNENIFEKINTEEKAYWLGFIMADGCICTKNNNYLLRIDISNIDISHLYKFKKFIESESPIKENKKRQSVDIKIFSEKIINDLKRLKCFENKSLSLTFPNESQIPDHLIRHFIRGYTDGDGSLYICKNNNIGISWSSNKEFLESLMEILLKNNLINIKYKIQNPSAIHFVNISKRESVFKIINYLYKDCAIYLDRKYNKYLEIISLNHNIY